MNKNLSDKILKIKELITRHVNYPQFRKEIVELLNEIIAELEGSQCQCGQDEEETDDDR